MHLSAHLANTARDAVTLVTKIIAILKGNLKHTIGVCVLNSDSHEAGVHQFLKNSVCNLRGESTTGR